MGNWNNKQIEIEERGYRDSYKFICSSHINDTFISDKIHYSHNRGKCSFCGKYRNVLPFNDILKIVTDYIHYNYLRADGNAIYNSEEKDYIEPIINPYDFVFYELNSYLKIEDEFVLQELFDMLYFDRYLSFDSIILRERQEDLDLESWKKYCNMVRSCSLSAEQIISISDKKKSSYEIKAIRGMLDRLWGYCKEQRLVKSIYGLSSKFKAHWYYRCVNYLPQYEKGKPMYAELSFIPATLVGTAPANLVKDNRMSEAGDMMFYGADDKNTAMIEVGDGGTNPFTMGTFCSNKRFRILDLSEISKWKCPSRFDIENAERRSSWFFLNEFIERISEKTVDGNSYKPTQVFTKYIQRKTDLQGIKYKSSKTGKGCYVLFVVNRDCLDSDDKRDSGRNQLIMEKVEQI